MESNKQGLLKKIKNIIKNLMYLLGQFLRDKLTGFLKDIINSFTEGWEQNIIPSI